MKLNELINFKWALFIYIKVLHIRLLILPVRIHIDHSMELIYIWCNKPLGPDILHKPDDKVLRLQSQKIK